MLSGEGAESVVSPATPLLRVLLMNTGRDLRRADIGSVLWIIFHFEPVMYLHRWFGLLFHGIAERVVPVARCGSRSGRGFVRCWWLPQVRRKGGVW